MADNKSKSLLEMLAGSSKVDEEDYKDKDKDKDLVPINEPEDEFSDINVGAEDGEGQKDKKSDEEVTAEIIKFFKDNPSPSDDKVHSLADTLGIEHSDLEAKIYALLTKYLNVGKHQESPDDDFDADQLQMGIDVEKEHTDDPALAKEIAKDHLAELPDYYTRLKKMEDEGKGEGKKEEPSEKPVGSDDENDV